MIDFILGKFSDISQKCLERNAKALSADKKDIQLVFKFGSGGEVEYMIMNKYKPQKVITFLEVLGVRLDFKGYSLFVPNFIKGALNRFCEEDKINANNVAVIISCNDKSELIIWLYNGNTYVRQITLESLFDSEDILNE